MATHTPAQAIQELVNHTAVLTERLVGLQTEVRKGMSTSPELGNALTQVVGDTKRMLQAIEHLARLPAFHLDREGLNAAVAAGVQQGLSGEGGASLAALIESNGRHLDEARRELTEAKRRMDEMLEQVHATKVMTPEGRNELFKQIAPVAGAWSVAMMFLGIIIGSWVGGGKEDAASTVAPTPAAQTQTQRLPSVGVEYALSAVSPIYNSPDKRTRPAFNGPQGTKVTVMEVQRDGWVRISFKTGPNSTGNGWLAPGTIQP